ncbi:MAG: hypothetical protein ACXWUR_09330, partial [Allosphingosinicella sp.]
MGVRKVRTTLLAASLAVTALAADASADATRRAPLLPFASCFASQAEESGGTSAAPPPMLVEGLGRGGLEPDSDDPQARAWFEQGVRLVWAFDESEAIRAFGEAQRRDPECAMCFFGEAWARSPTINLQPRTEELVAARTAASRATALSAGLRERDRLLIQAINLRTADGATFNQRRYAAFMENAARRLPQDATIAVMAADARMQVSARVRPDSFSQRLLERVLTGDPEHVGAIHFYIHLTDWIDRQSLAVPYAERLGALAPAASHLVHMPSHTFYGVGRYRDAAAVNVAAIAADDAYVGRVRPPPSDYRTGLRAHDMHFAMNSALMRGDGETAQSVAGAFRTEYLTGEVDRRVRAIGSAAFFVDGLHGYVDRVLAKEAPDAPILRVFHHYARGEALARRGDGAAVGAEAAAIAALREGTEAPGLGSGARLAELYQR